ncbi:hypothetical protein STEG23_008807 [Scotinomys teguina]
MEKVGFLELASQQSNQTGQVIEKAHLPPCSSSVLESDKVGWSLAAIAVQDKTHKRIRQVGIVDLKEQSQKLLEATGLESLCSQTVRSQDMTQRSRSLRFPSYLNLSMALDDVHMGRFGWKEDKVETLYCGKAFQIPPKAPHGISPGLKKLLSGPLLYAVTYTAANNICNSSPRGSDTFWLLWAIGDIWCRHA